jgi:HAD superfamily hydrolase (TIGR01509 family)
MHAVIFDMDGVMVESESHWRIFERDFLTSLTSTWTQADQRKILGLGLDDLYTLLSSEYHVKTTKDQFVRRYHERAREIYGQHVALTEGFSDVLSLLNQHRVLVGLASSSPRNWIDLVLQRFGLQGSFQVVVSAEEVEGKGKPEPAIYLLTTQQLGVPAARCVAIEDSKNGVLSAKQAGMFCIGLRNGFNEEQDLSKADLIIHHLAELNWQTLQRLLKKLS